MSIGPVAPSRPRVAFAVLAAAVLAAAALLTAGLERRERARGADLFEGRQALQARLNGHTMPLPAAATRCANCHAQAGAERGAPLGGRLDGRSLTTVASRRLGPPSRFDARSLCRLLRTGVDAADVMVPPTMPRYEVSDADCDALWHFLSRS